MLCIGARLGRGVSMKKGRLQPLSMSHNFSWTLFGNIVYAASQWGVLIVLAKLGNATMVGQYGLGLAITAPIILFANLRLREVQVTDTSSRYQFGEYFSLRLVMILAALAIISFTSFMFGYERDTVFIVLSIGLCKGFEAMSDMIFGLLQKNERMDRIAISLMIQGPLSLLLFSSLLFATNSLLAGVLGMVISRFFLLIIYDRYNAKQFAGILPRFQLPILWQLFKLSLPLGIVQLFISLYINIPRYFLENEQGEEMLGYFSAISYVLVAGDTFISALSQAATPRLANHFHAGKRSNFLRLLFVLVAIALVLGILGVAVISLFGEQILSVLYQPDYIKYKDIFVLLMFAAMCNYIGWFLEAAMNAARRFKVQLSIAAVWLTASGVSSFILVPAYGMQGAAYSLIFTAAVQLLSKFVVLLPLFKNFGR